MQAIHIPGPQALYATSKQYRRILFLEMMAGVIAHAEHDRDAAFCDGLKQNRIEHWGNRPWPGAANDEEQFLKYVADMARVFAGCDNAGGAWYPHRQHGPLVGMDL